VDIVDKLEFRKLNALESSSNDATKIFLTDICNHGSARISLKNGNRFCPDLQYKVEGHNILGIVVEAAFSDPVEYLSPKSINYLALSSGHIRLWSDLMLPTDRALRELAHCAKETSSKT
jgi:hypothetical protein